MRTLLLVLLLPLAAGCATLADGIDPSSVDGTDTLVLYLEDQGFTLEPSGLSSSVVPITTAVTYRVAGVASPALLEVFEFEHEAAAEAGLVQLRAEIRPRVRQAIYARGPLVVYARPETYGQPEDGRLRRALASALGSPRTGA